MSAHASNIDKVRMVGPFSVKKPFMVDSLSAAQSPFSENQLIECGLDINQVKNGKVINVSELPLKTDGEYAKIMLTGFSFKTNHYSGVDLKVEGVKNYVAYINGEQTIGKTTLQPGQYDVVLKYIADTAQIKISVSADKDSTLTVLPIEKKTRSFSMADNMLMKHYSNVSVSPSGKYAIFSVGGFNSEGGTAYDKKVVDVATGRVLMNAGGSIRWMPKSDLLLETMYEGKSMNLRTVNPVSLEKKVIARNVPNHYFYVSPSEDFLIMSEQIKGPKKENGVYEVLCPDDRQPGWRDRSRLLKYDLKSGLIQPLTFGFHSQMLFDISDDGQFIVFGVSQEQLLKQPYSTISVFKMDLQSLEVDTLFANELVASVSLACGDKKLLVRSSAGAFNRIGCVLPDNLMPNEYEYQLYMFDIAKKKPYALTRDFNPSVSQLQTTVGNNAFFIAENADSVSLYRLDLKTNRISYVPQSCEEITQFSVSRDGSVIVYAGTSACAPSALYALNTKSGKAALIENENAARMAELEIGKCYPLRFMSKRGYELTGHYYLPANFDASKKYPVIVHYYGGCSPTSRRFGGGTHYPAHYWNAMGYVVLIVNPSGASGFGQEWGSRHVNTMGEGVAEDIIETTQYFIDNNKWVNAKKIGCVSASYGGFMTQLLLTKTDMFAAGISHAGISDHTSYWGEGYWGYSYSQISAANSFPWTRKDLYVDRSPLYNADKIHTPLLFTHGTADTNVPIGESIQMYTALKLLGSPTAFVMVEGENHGIMDFTKRQKWINTMVAWFHKYLQDDDSWWNAIYTPKNL